MKKTNKLDIIIWLLMIITFGSAWYFYNALPDQVVTHWNAAGEPDDWGSKTSAVLLAPIVMVGVYLLFLWLPKLDPKKENYEKFFNVYKGFQLLIIVFFLVIHFLTNFVNLGYPVSMDFVMPILVGILFIVIGLFMKNIKPNWFMGIRNPWTLSNDEVWRKTHMFGGKMFILAGLLFVVTAWLPSQWFVWVILVTFGLIFSTFVYSYLVFKKVGDKKPEID